MRWFSLQITSAVELDFLVADVGRAQDGMRTAALAAGPVNSTLRQLPNFPYPNPGLLFPENHPTPMENMKSSQAQWGIKLKIPTEDILRQGMVEAYESRWPAAILTTLHACGKKGFGATVMPRELANVTK